MKSKAPLSLVEQLIMILVFAIAAAVCLNAFAFSDRYSGSVERKDHAVREAENAAELLKAGCGDTSYASSLYGGTADGDSWTVYYDASWTLSEESESSYCLTVQRTDPGVALLSKAEISVGTADGAEEICRLSVCWQEEKK